MNNKGSVALTTVLVISAVLLMGGVTLVLTSMDLALSTKDYESKITMTSLSRTCLEESLIRLKSDPNYVGTVSYSNDGSCTANITIDGVNPGYRNINVVSILGDHTLNDQNIVDVSTSPYQIIK